MITCLILEHHDLIKSAIHKSFLDITIADFDSSVMQKIMMAHHVEFVDINGCKKVIKDKLQNYYSDRYLEKLLAEYEGKSLVYRADTVKRIIKEIHRIRI